MYKRSLIQVFSACMFLMSSLYAADDDTKGSEIPKKDPSPITGTFDITSNYIFRGVTQTNNIPAVQGGFTATMPVGIYGYIWGSNVNFADAETSIATLELDTAIGYTNTIGDNFTYNVTAVRYNYPKTSQIEYNEYIGNVKIFIFTALVAYSHSVFGTNSSGTYYNVGINYDIPSKYAMGFEGMNITGGVGHYTLPFFLGSYNDYTVQLSKTIGAYKATLAWTNTNGNFLPQFPGLSDNKIIFTFLVNF